MHRFVLLALPLFLNSAVLCQSMAAASGISETPQKLSAVQMPLNFGNDQPGQAATKPAFKNSDCNRTSNAPNEANAPIDLNHLFSAQCADPKSHIEPFSHVELFARNENSFSRSLFVFRAHPKGEPLPTQWPNLKVEQIPTQWPNLKLQPIGDASPRLVPSQSRAK